MYIINVTDLKPSPPQMHKIADAEPSGDRICEIPHKIRQETAKAPHRCPTSGDVTISHLPSATHQAVTTETNVKCDEQNIRYKTVREAGWITAV